MGSGMLLQDEEIMTQEQHITIIDEQPITGTIDSGVHRCPCEQCPLLVRFPDDGILLAWLDEKTGRTNSWKTHVAYHRNAVSLRAKLRAFGYELLMDLSEREVLKGYLQIVQKWAGERAPGSQFQGRPVAAAGYNQRLASISSLFQYARKKLLYTGSNPIELLERRKVHPYAGAQPLPQETVSEMLVQIPATGLANKRDSAILDVALETATRGQALLDLKVKDLTVVGSRLRVFFRRTKGNKNMTCTLEKETSAEVIAYLTELYGEEWERQTEDPVWVSLASNGTYGQQLSIQGLGGIYLKWLRTSKTHTSRHSTVMALIKMGVPTRDIKELLGHEHIATTELYVPIIQAQTEEKYGKELTAAFGLGAARKKKERVGEEEEKS